MFLAHKNDLKNKTYIPLEQLKKHKVLVNDNEYKLVSNICPHQGSLISKTSGDTDIRVCPFHGWSFDLNGKPIASGRTAHYCQNTKNLNSLEVFEFCDMLFDKKIKSDILNWLDLSNMKLMEQRIDVVNASHTTIMDLFLDVDHIESVHRGVYNKIGLNKINEVQWHYYDWGSVQLVNRGEEYAAAWIAVYPGTMIEWQDGSLFVTVSESVSETQTKVHVFKYMDTTRDKDWELNESVWEEAWKQDKAQAELIAYPSEFNLEFAKRHYRERS